MEIEAKFHIQDLSQFRIRLLHAGARCTSPRTLERNLRFDTPGGDLAKRHAILRLRQDSRVTCTYKEPLDRHERRVEHEVEVDNFNKMQAILESLGFECIFIYEKYRETFQLDDMEIMLDELPFGHFVEVEGPDLDAVSEISRNLDLNWERRVALNYIGVFENLQKRLRLTFRDATFEHFSEYGDILSDDLGFPFAD